MVSEHGLNQPNQAKRPRDDAHAIGEGQPISDHAVTTVVNEQVKAGEIIGGATVNPAPARGYSWPPFAPGHTLSLVHGADSERTIAARAELVRPRLYEVCPWLHETMDVIAVDRFLRAESRALLLHEHIIAVTEEKGAGRVASRLWEQATAADNLAAKLGNVLGLDPTGRARLQQTVANTGRTLADLTATGRQIVEQHQPQAVTE